MQMTITRLSNDVLTSHHLQTWKHLQTFNMEGAYFRTPHSLGVTLHYPLPQFLKQLCWTCCSCLEWRN
jgi:hypothetical protein